MFKNFIFIALVAFMPLLAFSQQTDKLGFESGLVLNEYFPRQKLLIRNNHPVNYFLKLEYCGKTLSRNNWTLFIPFGISYSYYTVDYSPANGSGPQSFYNRNLYHNFVIFVGPEFQYQRKGWRFCAALLLNNRYVSSRIIGLYNMGKRLWFGPSIELFFYDILYSVDEYKNNKNIPNYQRGNIFGINGNAIRLNAGFKLQMDLKY